MIFCTLSSSCSDCFVFLPLLGSLEDAQDSYDEVAAAAVGSLLPISAGTAAPRLTAAPLALRDLYEGRAVAVVATNPTGWDRAATGFQGLWSWESTTRIRATDWDEATTWFQYLWVWLNCYLARQGGNLYNALGFVVYENPLLCC